MGQSPVKYVIKDEDEKFLETVENMEVFFTDFTFEP